MPNEGVLVPGDVVDRKYRIESLIAEGGVGKVFLATHLELRAQVALKCLHRRYASDRTVVSRFKREARLAASIASPHVIKIHDVGTTEDGIAYMVMEHLSGEDLASVLRGGPVAIDAALAWMVQVCEALDKAHALGIIHRDLKPENLFLTPDSAGGHGTIKVLDFGISKAGAAAAMASLPPMHSHPPRSGPGGGAIGTAMGELFGTPLYMSPEQIQSASAVDPRSDLWALGIVLFELLTGKSPFPHHDLPTLLANVLSVEPARLDHLRPEVGLELGNLVASCLAKTPRERPASARQLADAIEQLRAARARPTPVPVPSRESDADLPLVFSLHPRPATDSAFVSMGSFGPAPRRRWGALGVIAGVCGIAGFGFVVASRSVAAAGAPAEIAGHGLVAAAMEAPRTTSAPAALLEPLVLASPIASAAAGASPAHARDAGAVAIVPLLHGSAPAPVRPRVKAAAPANDYAEFGDRR